MPTYRTPGVYFEKPRPREPAPLQRTDIAGFVGLAQRGPLHDPQRLTTWREFQETFGGFLPHAHLAYAVRAFFENGGRVCWVVRVADQETARAASLEIPEDSGAAVENALSAYIVEAASEGTWGQQLAVSVQAAHLAATEHEVIMMLPDDRLAVTSTTGFEPGSWVQLTQASGDSVIQVERRVEEVDVVLGVLRFDASLESSGLTTDDPRRPISLESREFTLLVWQADQVAERFAALAPDPSHSRYAVNLVNSSSRLIRLARGRGFPRPRLPWRGQLRGGTNGLRTMDIFDYIGGPLDRACGLTQLAQVEEVNVLAMPDLTIQPTLPKPLRRKPRLKVKECALDTPAARTDIVGQVIDAETQEGLHGVEVSDGLQQDTTDSEGFFRLDGLLPGAVDLVLHLTGYVENTHAVVVQALPSGAPPQDLGQIELAPLDLPPSLSHADIAHGQMAMIAQCEERRNRFALLDPPLSANGQLLDTNTLRAWRARFDTRFAALYYPWLVVHDPLQPDAPQGRLVPPCGHVAGTYAATDLSEGVFRAPANQALSFVDDVGVAVDERLQGVLNPLGINVIRALPGRGIRVYGARTLSSESAWRFVNVRRLMSMLEEALHNALQWAVFEPNDIQLRLALRLSITTLLDSLWRRGAFLGDSPDAAYRVRCDEVTSPPEARAEGRLIAEIGVAPTVPYEFIILRLGLTSDELQISEV
ncbi:MAG: phage tail sheath subtilisin-like domain-containing protein [Anaerolineae bacterium]|jgi:phage tail sheath protein FI